MEGHFCHVVFFPKNNACDLSTSRSEAGQNGAILPWSCCDGSSKNKGNTRTTHGVCLVVKVADLVHKKMCVCVFGPEWWVELQQFDNVDLKWVLQLVQGLSQSRKDDTGVN